MTPELSHHVGSIDPKLSGGGLQQQPIFQEGLPGARCADMGPEMGTAKDCASLATVNSDDVKNDVDLILWSAKLSDRYRYSSLRFWKKENLDLEYATKLQGEPRIESVADHTWHLCDVVLLLAHRFQPLDIGTCLCIATLHDKLEIITEDKNPIGRDGTGDKAHAFNQSKQTVKDAQDYAALQRYGSRLSEPVKAFQTKFITDFIEGQTREARFVKALDKLDPITFVIRKKQGEVKDQHLQFTVKYSRLALKYFPELQPYWAELIHRLILTVADCRAIPIQDIESIALGAQDDCQLEIPLE